MVLIRSFILILLLLLACPDAKADFINLIRADQCETIVEIFVEPDQIRLSIEIGEKDYPEFKWIIPEAFYPEGFNEATQRQLLNRFFNEGIIVEADGKVLTGDLKTLKRIPRNYRTSLYTGQIDTLNTDISKHVIHVELTYKVSKPKVISITPPLREDMGVTFANIGFVTYHKKIPVNDLRYLDRATGQERRLDDQQRAKLVEYLAETLQRTFDQIRKKLRLPSDAQFNFERGDRNNCEEEHMRQKCK